MPENQTTWDSNNQGVKETFTQTSRRDRDGQVGGQRGHTPADGAGKLGPVERTLGKVTDHVGKAGMAE